MSRFVALAFALAGGLVAVSASASSARAEEPTVTISIKDHRFEPSQVEVPANTKVKLIVRNLDPTAEEFESNDLRREKVIQGGQQATIYIGPLNSGRYEFFGEFNPQTARGFIVAK